MAKLPASFRGVSFWVESSDLSVGRRTVTHQYPQRDEPFTEDLGRAAREYRFSAFVLGDDYIEQAKKLREALEKPGAATLVHPEFGEIQVVAQPGASMSFSQSMRRVNFALAFVEAGLNAFPTPEGASQQASRAAADKVSEAAAESFEDSLTLDNIEDFVQDALSGDLLDALDIISNSEIAKVLDFADRVSDLAQDAIGLVRGGPMAFATKLMGALGLSRLATTVAGWQRVGKSLCALADDLRGDDEEPYFSTVKPKSAEVIESNRKAVYSLCRQAVLVQAVGVSTLIGTDVDSTVASSSILPDEGETVVDSESGAAQVGTVTSSGSFSTSPTISYDEMLEARERIVGRLEEEMLDVEDDRVFMALREAATAVSKDLSSRAEEQARLYDYDAGAVLPSCVTAMELYGDATRAQEIVVRNGVTNSLFCPNVLKVLNE